MFRKVIFAIASAALLPLTSCTEKNNPEQQDTRMLKSLQVRIENSNYHGKVDYEGKTITFASIKDTEKITDVICKVAEGVTVTPDPTYFIGKWQKEQSITLQSDNTKESYSILFPKFGEKPEPEPEPERKLIFFDDFKTDGTPNKTYWSLCEKGGSDWCDEMSESYNQAFCKDGKLILRAELINGELKAGGISTLKKFAFTYGNVTCKARITKHPNGAFPAIWLFPQKYIYPGWPECGEIDIMEHLNQDAYFYQTLHNHYHNTLKQPGQKHVTVETNIEEWNIYGVRWTPESITFTLNGKDTFTYNNKHLENEAEMKQWPFQTGCEMYVILNMGLGNDGSWAGSVDKKNLPAEMEIDWIKVTELVK